MRLNENVENDAQCDMPRSVLKPPEHLMKICCAQNKRIRYCQPPVPKSYAPHRVYKAPQDVFEDKTTYNISYFPLSYDIRRKPIIPSSGNVMFNMSSKFDGETNYKLSYLPVRVPRREPIRPVVNEISQKGPMQDLTTQKHDYVPRPICMRKSFKPVFNFYHSNKPFEGKTIYYISYPAPGDHQMPKSYAPVRYYTSPSDKMECATTYKTSFLPNAVIQKWIPQKRHDNLFLSGKPIDAETTYETSYPAPGWEIIECSCVD